MSKVKNLFSQSNHSKERKVAKHRSSYLLNENTPFEVMEAFRSLKASLSVSVPKKPNVGTIIVATSPYPEDGKTTVSVNLALMFALSDAKVLVLDADIRKGRISKFFKQKREPGLSNYLSGQVSLERMTYRSKINPNLSFITCGTHSPRPYELLESQEMAVLIEKLREQFDYVIIDTPPILLVSDALAFSHLTDGTMLVCRHQESSLNDIERAIKTLSFAKTNILGVVINDFKGEYNKKYGYDKYHYYQTYSYGAPRPYVLNTSAKRATKASAQKLFKTNEEAKEHKEQNN